MHLRAPEPSSPGTGLDVPAEPLLEVVVDMLTGHHARALVMIGKGIIKLSRTLFPSDS